MYYKLKSWVFERGGKLMYLGGNGLNCEVVFTDEYTMVVRNGDKGGGFSHLQKLGLESRFHFNTASISWRARVWMSLRFFFGFSELPVSAL